MSTRQRSYSTSCHSLSLSKTHTQTPMRVPDIRCNGDRRVSAVFDIEGGPDDDDNGEELKGWRKILLRILQFFGIIVLVLVHTWSILMIAETIRPGTIYGQDGMPHYLTETGDIAQVELPYKSVNGNSTDMDLTFLAAPTKQDAVSYMQILDNETADYLGYIGDLPLYNLYTGASSRRVSVLIPAFLVMGIILWFCSYKVFKNGKVITDFPASVKEIARSGRLKRQRIL